MAKALVVYYSRTGYTLRVAEKMAAALGADLERIEDAASRRGVLGYLRCAREALRKRAAVIRPPAFDPAAYDLVVVGGPVWAGNVASPVRAYLQASKGHIAHFACFCTQGGSGGPGVLAAMAALTGLAAEATLVLSDKEIAKGFDGEPLRTFVERLASLPSIRQAGSDSLPQST